MHDRGSGDPLTQREWQVAQLVAARKTNREIADTLVITLGTTERHLANILAKLKMRSRAELAAWVLDRD
jgi:DNA-binding NarL/FixJ family response regulator